MSDFLEINQETVRCNKEVVVMFEGALENKKLAPASQDLMGHGDWSLLVRTWPTVTKRGIRERR